MLATESLVTIQRSAVKKNTNNGTVGIQIRHSSMKLRSEVSFKRNNSSVKEEKALGMRWIVTRDLLVGCAY